MRAAIAILFGVAACDGVFKLIEVRPDAPNADGREPDTSVAPSDQIAWYKLDSIAGERAIDEIAGRDGICTSCPTEVATGRIDGALEFDGSVDIIDIPPTTALDTTSAFTVSVWLRQTSGTNVACGVSKLAGNSFENTWQLCTEAGNIKLYAYGVLLIGGEFSPNEWHHAAATWDGSVLALALDGDVQRTAPAMPLFDGGSVVIGGDRDTGNMTAMWPGLIDDVRIYNRALSGPELAALANP